MAEHLPGLAQLDRGAWITPDGLYRYGLYRRWGPLLAQDPFGHVHRPLLWIMLNPSTADGQLDDPTIRRVRGFTERAGYSWLVVANLFALRSSSPRLLLAQQARGWDVVGPLNDRALRDGVSQAGKVVVAWGADAHMHHPRRVRQVLAGPLAEVELWSLGTTLRHGAPRHPLYVRATQELQLWDPPTEVRP